LQLELQRLDATRRRLAAGQADQALALLDAYERATPRGVLKLEAEVLRIDALARSGRLAQAQARAASFLARHPNSVLAARVRRIAGR
jgi:outer membrane protein assembly factor BamD (BamD/ComL family)